MGDINLNYITACTKRIVRFQYDWSVAQVREKDVLKCIITVPGELCVMMDLPMHLQVSFVTCSDTGRLLLFVHSLRL